MMKKILCLLFILSILCITMVSCSSYNERKCAKDLNKAIEAEDFDTVKRIISECPESINTYPTVAPSWWQGEMLMTRIYYPLSEACKSGNLEMVKLLVENGADVNSHNPDDTEQTPIHVALAFCKDDWYEIIMYLISKGASIDYVDDDAFGKCAIFIDIIQGIRNVSKEDEENLDKLFTYALENYEGTNADWPRILCQAAYWGRLNITKMLIESGTCDINTPFSGDSPLMYAIRSSDPKMVEYFLESGADINAVNKDGKTVFDYVSECDNEEIKVLFIDQNN